MTESQHNTWDIMLYFGLGGVFIWILTMIVGTNMAVITSWDVDMVVVNKAEVQSELDES